MGFVAGIPGDRGRFSRLSAVLAGSLWPGLRVLFGLPPVFMGIIACLAYMFIDLERNEVERGYKAVHNPLKGQALALNLELYGRHLRLPLLGCATVALIGGFALLNQGLYETIGRGWYQVANVRREPGICRLRGLRSRENPGHRGRAGPVQVAPYLGSCSGS